jgi:hypothetical protein
LILDTKEFSIRKVKGYTFDEFFQIGRAKRGYIDGILSEQTVIILRIFF